MSARHLLVAGALALAACHHHSALDRASPSKLQPPKDALSRTTENGPVKATVTLWPPKPHLGDLIYLRLEVTAPAGISIDAPFQEAGDQRMGRFTVVGFTRESTHTPDGGQQQDQVYTLEAPSSGKQRIPPLRLEMVDARGGAKHPAPSAPASGAGSAAGSAAGAGAGSAAGSSESDRPQEILTEEIPLDVLPVKQAAIDAKLHAAAGKLDPDVGGTPWILIIGLVSALAILGSGSLLVWRALATRRRLAKRRSAYDEAVAKLRALEVRGAPEAEHADGWFVELSAIVRGYLERRYDIRAPELTTEEFLQVAARAPELTVEHRALLSSFLERCDRVKFAGYRPDSDESIATLAAARGFVEDTRLREATDAPDAARPKEAA